MSTLTPIIPTRWMVRADFEAIEDIECNSFLWNERWGDNDFKAVMNAKNGFAFVAIVSGQTAGYVVYRSFPEKVIIERLAVNRQFRRQGVGRELLERVKRKLVATGRREAWFEVPEELLGAQLWLKACGWRCECIVDSAACEGQFYRFAVGVEN